MKYWQNPDFYPAFEHVRLLTASYSKSFYFSARLLPEARRWGTFALYGFCRYADNLIDNPRQRSTAELISEIGCFARELDLAYRNGESEHPIIKPFILVAQTFGIPKEYPFDLLKGVQMDLEINRYRTFADLYVFCYRVASVVGLMMTHVMGYQDESAFPYAEKLGIAMQLTNILRDVKEDKNMGRIYLPLAEISQYGLTEADFFQENWSDAMREFIKFQVQRAHDYYDQADAGIALLRPESQYAIYSASKIYQGILGKIEARNYNPFLGRVFVPFRKKLVILLGEVLRTRLSAARDHLGLKKPRSSQSPI